MPSSRPNPSSRATSTIKNQSNTKNTRSEAYSIEPSHPFGSQLDQHDTTVDPNLVDTLSSPIKRPGTHDPDNNNTSAIEGTIDTFVKSTLSKALHDCKVQQQAHASQVLEQNRLFLDVACARDIHTMDTFIKASPIPNVVDMETSPPWPRKIQTQNILQLAPAKAPLSSYGGPPFSGPLQLRCHVLPLHPPVPMYKSWSRIGRNEVTMEIGHKMFYQDPDTGETLPISDDEDDQANSKSKSNKLVMNGSAVKNDQEAYVLDGLWKDVADKTIDTTLEKFWFRSRNGKKPVIDERESVDLRIVGALSRVLRVEYGAMQRRIDQVCIGSRYTTRCGNSRGQSLETTLSTQDVTFHATFCRLCRSYGCRRHLGFHPRPVIGPLVHDETQNNQSEPRIKANSISLPCGDECYHVMRVEEPGFKLDVDIKKEASAVVNPALAAILPAKKPTPEIVPVDDDDDDDIIEIIEVLETDTRKTSPSDGWNAWELDALQTATSIFGSRNQCQIATLIGSKTCRQVATKMMESAAAQVQSTGNGHTTTATTAAVLHSNGLFHDGRRRSFTTDDECDIDIGGAHSNSRGDASDSLPPTEPDDDGDDSEVEHDEEDDPGMGSSRDAHTGVLQRQGWNKANNKRKRVGGAKKFTSDKKRRLPPVAYERAKKTKSEYWNQYKPCGCVDVCRSDCPCVGDINFCEKFCGCNPATCINRFQGCKCKATANRCNRNSCPCLAAGRECDPDLCRNCNQPFVEKKSKKIKTFTNQAGQPCSNMRIRLNQRKRVFMGLSDIQGWGAFLPDGAKKDELIGEYVGDLIDQDEADRRGRVYDRDDNSYLFNLNKQWVIDGRQRGNKLRFANHSKEANCRTQVLLVDGDHRVGVLASNDIAAGEELFYDYQYDKMVAPDWAKMKKQR